MIAKDSNTVALLRFNDPKNITKDECGNTWTMHGGNILYYDGNPSMGPCGYFPKGTYLTLDNIGSILSPTDHYTIECRFLMTPTDIDTAFTDYNYPTIFQGYNETVNTADYTVTDTVNSKTGEITQSVKKWVQSWIAAKIPTKYDTDGYPTELEKDFKLGFNLSKGYSASITTKSTNVTVVNLTEAVFKGIATGGSGVIELNSVNHIALVHNYNATKASNTLDLFINGTNVWHGTSNTSVMSGKFSIGNAGVEKIIEQYSHFFTGYINEFRISKTPRYAYDKTKLFLGMYSYELGNFMNIPTSNIDNTAITDSGNMTGVSFTANNRKFHLPPNITNKDHRFYYYYKMNVGIEGKDTYKLFKQQESKDKLLKPEKQIATDQALSKMTNINDSGDLSIATATKGTVMKLANILLFHLDPLSITKNEHKFYYYYRNNLQFTDTIDTLSKSMLSNNTVMRPKDAIIFNKKLNTFNTIHDCGELNITSKSISLINQNVLLFHTYPVSITKNEHKFYYYYYHLIALIGGNSYQELLKRNEEPDLDNAILNYRAFIFV